jgi:hypothetical protein
MDLHLLGESYPIAKSKLPFEDFVQSGLTGLVGRSNRFCPDLPILGVKNKSFLSPSSFFTPLVGHSTKWSSPAAVLSKVKTDEKEIQPETGPN